MKFLNAVSVTSLVLALAPDAWCQTDEKTPRILPGTSELKLDGDPSVHTVAGVDRFLNKELNASESKRQPSFRYGASSIFQTKGASISKKRQLRIMLGLHHLGISEYPEKAAKVEMTLLSSVSRTAQVGRGDGYRIFNVRWLAATGNEERHIHGEGLLLRPDEKPLAHVVAIGDCEDTPEMLAGLTKGIDKESQFARRLVESGCQVLIPTLINRQHNLSVIANGKRKSNVTHRELLYRSAYQMGRTLIGYEVAKVLTGIHWLDSQRDKKEPLGIIGYGEGGLLALYGAAVDDRIHAVGVSGYFNSRDKLWTEPIDRNIFGFLRRFGDAEIAGLAADHSHVVIEACNGPQVVIPPGGASAPTKMSTPEFESVRAEVKRAQALIGGESETPPISLIVSENGDQAKGLGPFGSEPFLAKFFTSLGGKLKPSSNLPVRVGDLEPAARHDRQFHELAAYSQMLLDHCHFQRAKLFAKITGEHGSKQHARDAALLSSDLHKLVIGKVDHGLDPPSPRSRLIYDKPKYRGYEILLDVFGDVQLYGILLIPKDLKQNERRPVVVCQHGLEGTSRATIEGDKTSYRDFAGRLATRGFVTFSPQHLYRGGDRFRTLQRKANPLGLSLFSIMIEQHRQLLNWLESCRFVDRDRIAFYGISYGGKSAMRIPAVLKRYCLSICSSDFSDWIWRTTSNRFANGYLAHSEYEIFEFNLGNTFNYYELAALICPRPFMVERFHHHGEFADRLVAEYGKVRLLYENVGAEKRTALTYYGSYLSTSPYQPRETFDFLHEHLNWPAK